MDDAGDPRYPYQAILHFNFDRIAAAEGVEIIAIHWNPFEPAPFAP